MPIKPAERVRSARENTHEQLLLMADQFVSLEPTWHERVELTAALCRVLAWEIAEAVDAVTPLAPGPAHMQ